MSLMQVLTRDSLQSTTTPYAFLGSSTFIQESRDNCMPASSGSLYFPASRERNIPASDASTAVVGGEGIQQHYLSSTGTEDNLKLSNTSDNQLKEKAADEWEDTTTQSTVPQQTMNNLQHVAQQSRREKLRIPGSLQHPASPQSGNHSDHSAGSALVLEMRQGASGLHQAQHPENMESPGNLRAYAGNSNQPVGDMLSVYNPMLASELYNFSTGAELLGAVSGKNQGYLCVSGTDGMPQAPGLVGSVYPGQGGFSNQGNVMPKGGNWSSINSQLGQFSTNSLPPNSLQGASGTSGGAAPSGISATLLVGSGLQPSSFGNTGRESYFTGPNAQEAMQLYLMNAAGYATYPDGSTPGNMVFIGPSNGGGLTNQLAGGHGGAGSAQSQQHLIGIPLHSSQQNSLSQNSQVTSVSNSPVGYQSGGRGGGTQTYTSWKNGDELLFMPASERAKSFNNNQEGNSVGLSHSVNDFSEYGMREASMGAGQQQPLHVENSQASAAGYQSLSLSLSSQQPQSLHGYDVLHQSGLDSPAALSQDSKRPGQIGNKLAGDLSHFRRDYGGGTKQMHMDTGSSAMSASFSIISSSRYLKACQQLLEEVCSVGRGVKQSMNRSSSQGWAGPSPPLTSPTSANKDGAIQEHSAGKDGGAGTTTANTSVSAGGGGTSAGISPGATATASGAAPATSANEGGESASTLTTEERQEYEMKKSKLVAMLQEVDRRYRQYYDQMQVVISSFDAVAGVGAATPYTALALQAMSRYFRCLKDAITGQIQIVCKALGEEDISKQLTSKGPTSRLRFIDQQLRQQRAFQQLGMLNQHAWRPQRGLPERSVSILRAWLFEHFLHPYPKDADKMMLARQTGLTRSQVSNWFINARVRLWKPMVEEMYQEETREHELNTSRMHADNDDYSGDGRGDKSGKGGGEQGGVNDSKSKGEGSQAQEYIQDDGSHDYIPGSAIRKQNLGPMADSQMYDDAEHDGLRQAQLKKSRFGVHDPTDLLMPSNANMDVDLKTESNDGMPESDHKFGNDGIANGALHHHQQSFGGYDGSLRYANGGFPSRYNPGSGVSLTLGLQHSDNLSLSGAQQAYLHGNQGFAMSRRENVGAAEHDYSSLYQLV